MTRFTSFVGLGITLSLVTGCPPADPTAPAVLRDVPTGTPCGQIALACYDEFTRQPSKVICFREQSRWSSTELSWRLAIPLTGLDEQLQIDAAEQALALWADASNLSFTSTAGDADITISFSELDHGDDFPFDGPGSNLGHAFFPGSGNAGAIHLCSAEDWGAGAEPGEFDLFGALVHEIGHALGVEHSLDPNAVMAPNYMEGITELSGNDVEAIRRLYGSAEGEVPAIIQGDPAFEAFCADADPGNLTARNDPDTDGDGIPDTLEAFVLGTDPVGGDTDNDQVSDFVEVFQDFTDPGDSDDFNPSSIVETIPDEPEVVVEPPPDESGNGDGTGTTDDRPQTMCGSRTVTSIPPAPSFVRLDTEIVLEVSGTAPGIIAFFGPFLAIGSITAPSVVYEVSPNGEITQQFVVTNSLEGAEEVVAPIPFPFESRFDVIDGCLLLDFELGEIGFPNMNLPSSGPCGETGIQVTADDLGVSGAEDICLELITETPVECNDCAQDGQVWTQDVSIVSTYRASGSISDVQIFTGFFEPTLVDINAGDEVTLTQRFTRRYEVTTAP